MDLPIGNIISNLRREKGFTQEQLANAVGVSTPAVSKWETGNAYPDITLLSPIARFLGATVDTLLSFEKAISPEQVREIEKKCAGVFETETYDTAVAYCDRYLHEYPNDLFLKFRIAGTMQIYLSKLESEEQLAESLKKIINLFEQSALSEDIRIKLVSQQILGSLYMMTKDYDKAESILTNIPKADVNPDILLPSLYLMQGKVEKAKKMEQQNLYKSFNEIVLTLTGLVNLSRKQENYIYAIKMAQTQRTLIKLFKLEKFMLITNNMLFLSIYTDLKDAEASLRYLEEYVEGIKDLDYSKLKFSEIEFFDAMNRADQSVSSDFIRQGLIKELKENPQYDFVRADAKYNAILEKLDIRVQ